VAPLRDRHRIAEFQAGAIAGITLALALVAVGLSTSNRAQEGEVLSDGVWL
jgi:hypothetical protein